MEINDYDIIVVGCGLSGVVIAERFSLLQNKKVLIIDKRNHIGGNCYDYYDEKTNILMNKYGAHLFHTNNEEVFEYINQYGNWSPWEHKVLGLIDDKHLPIPANITTVNEIFNLDIKNNEEMDEWLSENQVKYENITNGEEMAKSRVGEVLYEKIFKHYTYKQWKKYPNELAPEVLARIPVRNSFDDRYFSDKYQVLPEKGYTAFFQSILDKHKDNIDVRLNCDFFDIKDQLSKEIIIIYTGPIDTYFADKGLPKLEYISIDFHIERQMNKDFYQPYSVVNYPSADTPYTRCVEYKHFLKQESDHTVYVKEKTTDIGEPYYPVLNDRNKELYKKYQKMAEEEENIHFLGRLASYKYFNMDQAIKNSLDYYKQHFEEQKLPKNIFLLWLQGWDNAPWLQRQVRKSWEINNPDWNIILLDEYNLRNYINDIDYIYDKCKNITYQAKSDIIRLSLLKNIGGVWADATMLCMQPLDNWVNEKVEPAGMWMYHGHGAGMPKEIGPAIWFIVSKKDNYIINEWKKECDNYWNGNNHNLDYFWLDEWFKNLYYRDNKFKELWSKVPYLYCEEKGSAHTLDEFKMDGCNEKLKKIFRDSPPYALKFWNFGNYFFNKFSDHCKKSHGYYAIQLAINGNILLKNTDPIIKIFCNKRKRVWFKNINNCKYLVKNPDTYIILTKNGEQKILPGIDYTGSDLSNESCSDLEQAKILTLTNHREFYFYIRGHVRNSFNTNRLKNFVNLLKSKFPNIKFILQTWKLKECKKNESWKDIKEDNTIISKEIIENYFEDKNITKQCLIIDENSIELVGSTNGTICTGPCPKRGWKNMWYGIYKGLQHLDNSSSNNFIVSFRYDFFDIDQLNYINEEEIIQFIKNNLNNLNNENIRFLKYNHLGTDNLYMGRYNKIKALIEEFHFKLDDIINMNQKIYHQEYLVNIVAETI